LLVVSYGSKPFTSYILSKYWSWLPLTTFQDKYFFLRFLVELITVSSKTTTQKAMHNNSNWENSFMEIVSESGLLEVNTECALTKTKEKRGKKAL